MPDVREPDKVHTYAQETLINRTSLSGGMRLEFLTCSKLVNGYVLTKRISPDMERIYHMRN